MGKRLSLKGDITVKIRKIAFLLLIFSLLLCLCSCRGEAGPQGPAGAEGKPGEAGSPGADGATPVIGENGNWWINGVDSGVSALGGRGEAVLASSYGVLPGQVDAERFQAMLEDDAVANRTILLADGVYVLSGRVELVSNVSLVGGANTVLQLSDESEDSVLLSLCEVDNVTLSHLHIDGGLSARPSTKGGRTGIWIQSSRSVNLDTLTLSGWDLYGLYGKTMSSYGESAEGKFYKQLQVLNTRFYNNYCGSYLDYRCEYTQMLNCVFGENHIGSVNCGGNNMYVSCMWNANTYGFLLENSGSNPAHGTCSASTFNHNTYPIKIENCVNGWIFDGCQIFYGRMEVINSSGVVFNGNIWGSCTYVSRGSRKNANLIANTFFLTDSASILKENDGSTAISSCLPDHLPENGQGETEQYLLYTGESLAAEKLALSTNAYSGALSHPIAAGTAIGRVDFEVIRANAQSVIPGVNVWVVNVQTGEILEQLIVDREMTVVYSRELGTYVVRVEIGREYDVPIAFAVQCERVSGVSIGYYQSDAANAGWLRGDVAPTVGEIIGVNSNVVPLYAVYAPKE